MAGNEAEGKVSKPDSPDRMWIVCSRINKQHIQLLCFDLSSELSYFLTGQIDLFHTAQY